MAPEPTLFQCLLAGGAAGTAVDVVLFPLDTLKTNLQSKTGLSGALKPADLYKGLASAAAGSAPAAAAFFLTYEYSKRSLAKASGTESAPWQHMTAACAGEAVGAVVRMPFEIVKQQLQAKVHPTTGTAIRHIFQHHGPLGFFNGYSSLVFREIPFSVIQFPIYEQLKVQMQKRVVKDGELRGHHTAVCGSLAGGFAAGVTTPLDVVKTRILLSNDKAGVVTMLRRIYTEEGAATLFSGLGPRVMWISFGGAIFFGAYEQAKLFLARRGAVQDVRA